METSEILLRIAAALFAGLLLGLERESRGRAAGLRTTILVCMSATLAMILSDLYYVSHAETEGWRPDPARLGAGILTGMGFIGAGVIVRQGPIVQGVTTAALLWFTTVIGFCFGSGQFVLGGAGFAIAAATLYGLHHLEKMIQNEQIFVLSLTAGPEGPGCDDLLHRMTEKGLAPRLTEVSHDTRASTRTAVMSLKFRSRSEPTPQSIVASLAAEPGVVAVSLR